MKKTLVTGLSVLCAATSFAAGEDLVNCTYVNGNGMDPRVCTALRQVAARKAAQQAEADRRAAVERQDRAAQQSEAASQATTVRQRQAEQYERQRAQEAERQAQADLRAAEWREKEAARKAEMAREQAIADKREAAQEKAAAEKLAALKARCGNDYKNPRVGMAIGRAQECVGRLKLTGEIKSTNGLVSIYEGSGIAAHVVDGKVVAWAK